MTLYYTWFPMNIDLEFAYHKGPLQNDIDCEYYTGWFNQKTSTFFLNSIGPVWPYIVR